MMRDGGGKENEFCLSDSASHAAPYAYPHSLPPLSSSLTTLTYLLAHCLKFLLLLRPSLHSSLTIRTLPYNGTDLPHFPPLLPFPQPSLPSSPTSLSLLLTHCPQSLPHSLPSVSSSLTALSLFLTHHTHSSLTALGDFLLSLLLPLFPTHRTECVTHYTLSYSLSSSLTALNLFLSCCTLSSEKCRESSRASIRRAWEEEQGKKGREEDQARGVLNCFISKHPGFEWSKCAASWTSRDVPLLGSCRIASSDSQEDWTVQGLDASECNASVHFYAGVTEC